MKKYKKGYKSKSDNDIYTLGISTFGHTNKIEIHGDCLDELKSLRKIIMSVLNEIEEHK